MLGSGGAAHRHDAFRQIKIQRLSFRIFVWIARQDVHMQMVVANMTERHIAQSGSS